MIPETLDQLVRTFVGPVGVALSEEDLHAFLPAAWRLLDQGYRNLRFHFDGPRIALTWERQVGRVTVDGAVHAVWRGPTADICLGLLRLLSEEPGEAQTYVVEVAPPALWRWPPMPDYPAPRPAEGLLPAALELGDADPRTVQERTDQLLELARAGHEADFRFLAGAWGVAPEELDALWTGTRARLKSAP